MAMKGVGGKGAMSQNRWTAEQDQYLIDHWQSQSDSELAEMVGHTAASVNARRQRLGLKHRESSKGPDWSREEVELMQELWEHTPSRRLQSG